MFQLEHHRSNRCCSRGLHLATHRRACEELDQGDEWRDVIDEHTLYRKWSSVLGWVRFFHWGRWPTGIVCAVRHVPMLPLLGARYNWTYIEVIAEGPFPSVLSGGTANGNLQVGCRSEQLLYSLWLTAPAVVAIKFDRSLILAVRTVEIASVGILFLICFIHPLCV